MRLIASDNTLLANVVQCITSLPSKAGCRA